jgi:glycine/D-amino acid oxidase-like deaminating enzyme
MRFLDVARSSPRRRVAAVNVNTGTPPKYSNGTTCDALVIGGGFYGCETALELVRLGLTKVVLVEREAGLLRRASFVNQARVHNGYHYPRAYVTALKSRKNFETFVDEYRYAVMHDLEKYYAIANGSRVTASQFEVFCERIGAFCRPAPRNVDILLEPGMIERVFLVRELAFDAVKIEQRLSEQLLTAGVELRLKHSARIVGFADQAVEVAVSGRLERAPWVFNCTYAELETVGVSIRTRIKKELAEMVLIQPPPQLRGRGLTVMDGPFFSTMPFPASGLHSLSHVRYTPHEASEGLDGSAVRPVKSNGVAMLRDASRFMPCLTRARIETSIFEVKAVLLTTENDDARPILIEASAESERVLSILGSKIDNIYELREYLRARIWR